MIRRLELRWRDVANRLEQRPDGSIALGRLGDEYMRLPGGVPYRWP